MEITLVPLQVLFNTFSLVGLSRPGGAELAYKWVPSCGYHLSFFHHQMYLPSTIPYLPSHTLLCSFSFKMPSIILSAFLHSAVCHSFHNSSINFSSYYLLSLNFLSCIYSNFHNLTICLPSSLHLISIISLPAFHHPLFLVSCCDSQLTLCTEKLVGMWYSQCGVV